MDWQEIVVTTTEEASDAVANLLQELGSGGVAIDDPAVIKHHIEKGNWDAYELPDDLLLLRDVRIKAYFAIDSFLPEKLEEVKLRLHELDRDIIPDAIKNIELNQVAEEDWANAWKAYFKPVAVGPRVVIKPTWEEYRPKEGELIIELDPGMAFGTGTHATTVMCLEALQEVMQGGEEVFDVGTGSGILAIAAAKLGAKKVLAVDMDATAVRTARENVELNGVDSIVRVEQGNLLDKVNGGAQLVVANIIARIIIELCPAVNKALAPGGLFIASGIIRDRWPEVQAELAKNHLVVKEVKTTKEWIAVIAEKGE